MGGWAEWGCTDLHTASVGGVPTNPVDEKLFRSQDRHMGIWESDDSTDASCLPVRGRRK